MGLTVEDYTYDNPGCYHDALSFASKITGLPRRIDLFFKRVEALYNTGKTGKKKLKYKSYNIYVIDTNGKTWQFFDKNQRFDQRGIVAEKFRVDVERPLKDYGIEIKSAGSYKDSLGGGWYSMCERFEINGRYFAMMDCTC